MHKNISHWFTKTWVGLICIFVISSDLIAAEREFYWFVENIPCEDYTVTVRSNCMDEPELSTNGFCAEQEVLIKAPSGKQTKTSLGLRQYYKDMLQASSFLCSRGKNNVMYLIIVFDNGGNCKKCESVDVIGVDGKWITKGGIRFDKVTDRIGLSLAPWPIDRFKYIKNKNRELSGYQ